MWPVLFFLKEIYIYIYIGRRTSKFAKENPKIAPPRKEKKKKNPKHLKCSLTRAKTKAIKELTPPLSFFLSLSLSRSLSLSVCPPH